MLDGIPEHVVKYPTLSGGTAARHGGEHIAHGFKHRNGDSMSYAFKPLDDFVHEAIGATIYSFDGVVAKVGFTQERAAEMIGCTVKTYRDSLKRGTIEEPRADRYATNLGIHMSEIWPEYWDLVDTAEQMDLAL